MKKILLTGFEPFGGRDINPSQLLVRDAEAPDGAELIRLILPVEFIRSGVILRAAASEAQPDIILSVGQAGGVPHLSVERVAVNLDNSLSGTGSGTFADNAGDAPTDRPVIEGGPAAYLATLPVWEIVKSLNAAEVPARASYSAGVYVCNHIMYTGCDIAAHSPGMKSGFIHVPFLPEQVNGEAGRCTMEYGVMLKGINTALMTLAKEV